jgi:formate hydrogenlyase transcriptional activator
MSDLTSSPDSSSFGSDSVRAERAATDEASLVRQLMQGTAGTTGERFLRSLVQHLAHGLGARHAFVAQIRDDEPARLRTCAFWSHGDLAESVAWPLAGLPCERLDGQAIHVHPTGVGKLFPGATPLVTLGIEGYLGAPLVDASGRVRGELAVFDERPLTSAPLGPDLLRMLAARAMGELDRIDVERRLRESEELFRDLFEEAPIAYVYEQTDTRFVSANRSFMDLLGLTPEQVPQTYGLSLVAPRDAEEILHDSLVAEQRGQERAAIEIELKRKDNGKPVWVQRWSRPEPDGKHTRTMIIDMTARVLAEREQARLQQQNSYLREEIKSEHNFEEIVGRSPAIANVLAQIDHVATTDATVLLLGDTGTGKELLARALHDASPRRKRPLIKVNCAALPAGLIESELFGHERGAFTGATEKRIGRFALADGGTIFLDEIGELAPEVQSKLLRVLQERSFEALGSTRTQRVDVRVVAATNRDLQRGVAEGTFRADLFYRLNVFPIRVPSLVERREDIPLLVHYFVARYATKNGRQITSVDARTMQSLVSYAWPGNIRELENVIERAVILARGPTLEIGIDQLDVASAAEPAAGDDTSSGVATGVAGRDAQGRPTRSLADTQRSHILEALRATSWVIDGDAGAAQRLGLKPSTLRHRMKKLGIERTRGADSPAR